MSDFELFTKLKNNNQQHNKTGKTMTRTLTVSVSSCLHENTSTDKQQVTCIDCGEELNRKIQNQEWKTYAISDTKRVSNPNRLQTRRLEDKSIYRDVEGLGFSETVVAEANRIYFEVTQGKICRGTSRKAKVFACIFHSLKKNNTPLSHEKLTEIFKLPKKAGLRGLKEVRLNAPKNSSISTSYITPLNIINEIMDKFSASNEQKEEVKKIYILIKNHSTKLNRARPQSVAAAVVYYWICMTNKNISLVEFKDKVGLSELTIKKLKKEIENILEKKQRTPGT